MKKIFALALISTMLFNTSCSNNDDGDSNKLDGSLTVEEGKQQLEDNSIKLLNKIEEFKNDDALNEIIELAEYLSSSNTTKFSGFKSTALNSIENASSIQSKNSLIEFNAKQSLALASKNNLIFDFEAESGVYEWNADIEDFEKIGESDDIIYKISYNENKNAIYSFTDFASKTVEGEELPTLAKANLKIDDITVFSQDYTATLQDNNLIPTKINNKTTIGGFVFETNYNNSNNAKIDQSFTFKIDSEVIIGYNYTAKGNFNNTDSEVTDIFDSVDFSFNFLDAKLNVSANDNDFDLDEELTIDEQIDLLNKNVNAILSINNKLIAESLFYKDQDTYTDYIYNETTESYEWDEVTEDIINVKFLFDDGTSSDFETYFEGSFTELEEKFEAVFEAYETLFEDVEI
ncbi:hypothetical protein BWZ22_02365 [Seonamhaeicola sp. S2-3]|uniref:hypothetical protein n=1 Tax=Seonamhaeicola sp. S2-3 TaxID=1936081 RepID=UPI000972ABE9|nr:hypothetical protein [Seonamhaeicola sp. S2-3]APY10146.1 hypothetical protein BWZ22_02365 [Seonamhaeicola sp. S2-3]